MGASQPKAPGAAGDSRAAMEDPKEAEAYGENMALTHEDATLAFMAAHGMAPGADGAATEEGIKACLEVRGWVGVLRCACGRQLERGVGASL